LNNGSSFACILASSSPALSTLPCSCKTAGLKVMGFNSKFAKLEKGLDGADIRADSVLATESRLSGVAAQPASRTNAAAIRNFMMSPFSLSEGWPEGRLAIGFGI
jgi:hypothetical protein